MKGYVYTIEVMLAIITIIFVLVFIFSRQPAQSESSLSIMKQDGYDAMSYLDQSGELRKMVYRNDLTALHDNISAIIPSTIVFDVALCTAECSSANLPVNRTIVNVDYFVAGYQNSFIGKKVRLWMWQKY